MADNNKRSNDDNGPCLIRCGSFTQHNVIPLKTAETTIGRNPGVTYCIASPVISRLHAVIKKTEDEEWTITDKKSMNGVYINGQKIPSLEPRVLTDGIKVSFGMKEEESDFTYIFHNKENDDEISIKRPKEENDLTLKYSSLLPPYASSTPRTEVLLKTVLEEKKELENKLKQIKTSLNEKAAIESALRKELHEEKMLNNIIVLEMKEQTKSINDEMELKNEKNLSAEYENFISQLESERQQLLAQVAMIDLKLANQAAESTSQSQRELQMEKQHVENIIATKMLKKKLLEEKLKTLNLLAENKKTESKDLNFITELMEMELQCIICSELFVEATTLNCSHSFCKKCINDWMKKAAKPPTCPICRRKIKTQTHSAALDSFIDRMAETFSEEMRERRTELLKCRKKPKLRHQRSLDGFCRGTAACNSRRSHMRPGHFFAEPIEIADSD